MPSVSLSPLNAQRPTLNAPFPLRGCVNSFYRNYKGHKLGPYDVRRWKEGGKVFKQYIKPRDVEQVQAACLLYREMQAGHYEAVRSTNRFIDNFGFWLRMISLLDRRKTLCLPYAQFFSRLLKEGMRIFGRPSLRRKVTREHTFVNGERVIVKTVHELDGTTKVFMVPISTNKQFEPEKRHIVTFEQQFNDLYKAIFGSTIDDQRPTMYDER